jgi:hypothetical protein
LSVEGVKLRETDLVEAFRAGATDYLTRLLLDSRVVELPMAYPQTFVMLSSLKPLFFNSLRHELRFSDHVGA